MRQAILRAGDAVLVLRPELGGAAESWTWRGRPVFRPASEEDRRAGSARRLGAFPMLPFAGRVRDGRFRWQGQDYQLPRNFEGEPHSIHGNAWQRVWTVETQSEDSATLVLEHGGDPAWPFAYRAEQRFLLDGTGLDLRLSLVNTHSAPAPAGLGWHPFFPRGVDASLGFQAGAVLARDAEGMPADRRAVEGRFRFDPMRPLGAEPIDDCYAGWDGNAALALPGLRLSLDADAVFGHLVVFTPPGKPFFCVEPLTHAPNDLNRPDGAMRVLSPGESLAGSVRMRITLGEA